MSNPSSGAPDSLRGRTRECSVLDDLVSAVRRSESRSLVLRGEAGIGKTALLEYATASAPDFTVLRTVGAEVDMELPYAALQQLCGPLFGGLERLAPPQRQAMEIVFGLSAGGPPDRYFVGLAVLSMIGEAAQQRPLLCVVDDAHWLDHASAMTLAFVARRLLASPMGFVFATRERDVELRDVAELHVRGVCDGDARALLSSVVRFKLDEGIQDRIIAETRGNPMALLELPQELTTRQLAGGFGLIGAQAVPGRIEESVVRRLDPLTDDVRRLLLVAAAEPAGDPMLLWGAAERLGIDPSAADAAAAAGMLAISERVTFRHPMVRSAVYGSAVVEERRAVHSALAEATDREGDQDRRAWHLAEAAVGPDEQVALELECSADRAQARGGLAAAAAFLQRAVALTQDRTRWSERALAAAEVSFLAGEFDASLELVARAEAGQLDEFQRARVDLLRGQVVFASGVRQDAPLLLLKAAGRLEQFDLDLAREAYLAAWGAAGMAGHLAESGVLLRICSAIRALPMPTGGPRPIDLLLEGLALLTTDGHAAATSTLQRAAQALADIPAEEALRWGWMATAASSLVWDFEGMYAIADRQLQLVRDAGALAQLPLYLSQLGSTHAWMGDFAASASLVAEIETVAEAIGSPVVPYTSLRVASLRGQEDEVSAAIAMAIRPNAAGAQGMAAAWAHWATAVLCNGSARYREAVSAARQATSESINPWTTMWGLPELVEAAVRVGDHELACDALERLVETTQHCGTDWALGIEARCRGLVSDGDTADALYREAIERLRRTRLRPELARAHLLYGEWLRRENSRVAAREQLHLAYEMFVAIEMEAFAERARAELQATAETLRKRTGEAHDDLTAQEQQIARLARDHLSNHEIAVRLFISPRTVEWHLRNVYTKLDIRSRRELDDALANSA